MVKNILCILFLICVVQVENKRYTLEQVVLLSRHGLRTPLSKVLSEMTPKHWPPWNEKPGFLTAKGSILEGYMGEFFKLWFIQEGLISKQCPSEDNFYVYANTKQRTQASAAAFVNSAFPDCNVTIHRSKSDTDPIFNPVIHNTSSIFKQLVVEDMRMLLKTLPLNASYENLEKVLDYRNSGICINEHKCDLTTDKNKVYVASGEKPNLSGPLKIANSAIDAFIMQYYEGFPSNKVAWGSLQTTNDWLAIMNLTRGYHNVIFNTSMVAKDIARPLLKYMSMFFFNNNIPKIVLLMGHDANMYTVLNSLKVKSYSLQKQYELTPIGGKVVFQKWFDTVNKRELLRINYIYQSSDQLRTGQVLNIDNPPQFELLELNGCSIDENGFCSWKDFQNIFRRLL